MGFAGPSSSVPSASSVESGPDAPGTMIQSARAGSRAAVACSASPPEPLTTFLGPSAESHVSALGHLSRQPGLSYSELGRRAGITPQSMQVTLQQLEQFGAVERRTAPGRGRTARLHVTAVGDGLIERGRHAIGAADRRLLDDLPTDQHEALSALLLQAFIAATHRRDNGVG